MSKQKEAAFKAFINASLGLTQASLASRKARSALRKARSALIEQEYQYKLAFSDLDCIKNEDRLAQQATNERQEATESAPTKLLKQFIYLFLVKETISETVDLTKPTYSIAAVASEKLNKAEKNAELAATKFDDAMSDFKKAELDVNKTEQLERDARIENDLKIKAI
jgi:hypothetical protein